MKTYKITLKTAEGEKAIVSGQYLSILEAAEEENLDLPYSCRFGACASCVGKLESGSIDQSEQNFLEPEQIEAGYILTCVAYPTSDCSIVTEVDITSKKN